MSLSNIATVAEAPAFAKRVMVAATMLGLPFSKEMVLYVAVECRDEITEPEEEGIVLDGSTIADDSILSALRGTMNGAADEVVPEPEPEPDPEVDFEDVVIPAPVWEQPENEDEAYTLKDRVLHNGTIWVSTYDGPNLWEPGTEGWEEEA